MMYQTEMALMVGRGAAQTDTPQNSVGETLGIAPDGTEMEVSGDTTLTVQNVSPAVSNHSATTDTSAEEV